MCARLSDVLSSASATLAPPITNRARYGAPRHDRGLFSDFGRLSAAFSGGRRNALQVVGEELSEGFARGVVAEALAGAVVELAAEALEPGGGRADACGPLG